MKKQLLLLFLAAAAHCTYAQKLTDSKMTFCGLDFSKARMIGGGFSTAGDVKGRLFNTWNGLFKAEADKYSPEEAFKKDIAFDFTYVERNNKAVDSNTLITNNDYSITDAEAAEVVQNYDIQGKKGLGCAFVVESFDKSKATGFVYVIFFDMATKKIILNKKMEGEAGGFGLKAYWGNSIYRVLKECKKEFPKWLKGK